MGGTLEGEEVAVPERAVIQDGLDKILYGEASDWAVVEAVKSVAKARDVKPAQVALAWLLQRSAVTAPILGATKLQHLEDALAAVTLELSKQEIAALEAPYEPHSVKGMGPPQSRRGRA